MIWSDEIDIAVTLTDSEGKISYMNKKSQSTFENAGQLIGTDLKDCHKENSNRIINNIIESKISNIYTIEKKGVKKLICQAPYFENGEYAGLAELSIVLPENMPHFIRE